MDIGTPNPVVSSALYKDLQLDKEKQLTFQIGDLSVGVPSEKVVKSDWFYGFRKNTEFILPGSVMEHYQVAIDYSARTLTFAKPGTLRPEGIPVPCQVNGDTGLISVGITVDGRSYRKLSTTVPRTRGSPTAPRRPGSASIRTGSAGRARSGRLTCR